MKKRLFILIVWILAVLWVSNAQTLTLLTDWNEKFWYWCIIPIDIYADAGWQSVDSLSLIINSKLTFFDFVPSTWFVWHFLKPASVWQSVFLKWFASIWSISTWVWKIWTIYYMNQLWDTSADVYFSFSWQWIKWDSDLYNRWVDVLKSVATAVVYLDENISCNEENNMVITWWMVNIDNDEHISQILDDLNEEYNSLHGSNLSFMRILYNNWIISLIVLILIVFILIMFFKRKKSKVLILVLPVFLFFWFTSSAYLYFNWNSDNWFQQWCSETLNLKMDAENIDISTIQWKIDLDSNTNPIEWIAGVIKSYFNYGCDNCIYTDNVSQMQILWLKLTLKSNKKNWESCTTNSCWVWQFNFQPTIKDQIDYPFVMHIDSINLSKDKPENNEAKQLQNAYYTWMVTKQPCFPDNNPPFIDSLVISWTSVSLSWNSKVEYSSIDWFSLLLREPDWSKWLQNVPARYKDWYLQWWTWNKDNSISNQYWIAVNSFELHVDWNGNHKNLKCSDNWVHCTSYGTTWEWRSLNYSVTIDKSLLFNFWIEKTITVTGYVSDNTWYYKNIPNKSALFEISFNNPEPPTIDFLYPNNSEKWSVNINLNPNIQLHLSDDWAGVDTWSLKIIFTDVNNDEELCVMQWDDFNGWMFTLISWTEQEWWAWSYDVNFMLPNKCTFPEETLIKMHVEVDDLVDTRKTDDLQFTTRPACDKLACCVPMNIEMITWSLASWFMYQPYWTMTGLLISWNYQFTSGWAQNESGEWIWTWTLICQTSGLSLYSWSEEDKHFLHFTDWETLTISGNNVVAEFSWNQLILRRASEVTLSTIYPTVSAPRSNFDFEWWVTWTWKDSLSWYKIELYSGECGASDPMWSGYFEWSGTTTWAYTGNPLTSLQQYCWKVSAMQGNRVVTWATATFTAMMEIIVSANLNRSTNNNITKAKILLYTWYHLNPIYSWIIYLWESWTWVYEDLIESWCYYAVLKTWQYLSSYVTWLCITPDTYNSVDFSSWQWVTELWYLKVWDMPTLTDWKYSQDFYVNWNDFTIIYWSKCLSWALEVKNWFNEVCDVNRDWKVSSADWAPILQYDWIYDVAYWKVWWVFSWFGYFDYGF